MMKAKIGLTTQNTEDEKLITDLETVLAKTETDMTIFFRNLGKVSKTLEVPVKDELTFLAEVMDAFYKLEELKGEVLFFWKDWMKRYVARLQEETATDEERKQLMDMINPKYVLRNYMAQLAIDAANKADYSVVSELFTVLEKPYNEQPEAQKWFTKRPEWARTKVGCSILSCSS